MTSEEIAFTSLSELARRIADKQLSPIEVTETVLARIKAHDGVLNSYITVMADTARAAAKVAEEAVLTGRPLGLLHGVPVAVNCSEFAVSVPPGLTLPSTWKSASNVTP